MTSSRRSFPLIGSVKRRGAQDFDDAADNCRRETSWREELEDLIFDESNRITKEVGKNINFTKSGKDRG